MTEKKNKLQLVYLSPDDWSYTIMGKVDFRMMRRPQLGPLYLSAVLEKDGFDTEILDQSAKEFTIENLIHQIKIKSPLFVGFYACDANESKLINTLQRIKKECKNTTIIIGGPGATLNYVYYLESGCDIVCIGEGEVTIVELSHAIKNNQNIENIKGICFKKNGKIISNPERELIKNIDSIPFPRYDKINLNDYKDFVNINGRVPYTTMVTSRGCFHRCSFCTSHLIWKRKLRQRSPENVIKEIDLLVNKYGVKYIAFQDDVFGVNIKWLEAFTNLLKNRKYDLNWLCILNPNTFKNHKKEAFNMMGETGCNFISLGLQSVDAQVLKNIHRDPKEPEAAWETIKLAKKNGMLTLISFIFGLPGDTEKSIKMNIDYSLKVKPHYTAFYLLNILKGSELDNSDINNKLCDLDEKQLKEWCYYARKKFTTNPAIISQNIKYILRYKPSWLLRACMYIPSLLVFSGIKKTAK